VKNLPMCILLTATTETTMEIMNQFLTSFSESAEVKSSLNNFLASLSILFSIIITSLLFVRGTKVPKETAKSNWNFEQKKTDGSRILQGCEQNSSHILISYRNGIWLNPNYSRIMDEKTDDHRFFQDYEQNSSHTCINYRNGIWFNPNYSRILNTKTDDHRILQGCDQNFNLVQSKLYAKKIINVPLLFLAEKSCFLVYQTYLKKGYVLKFSFL
jgi:hypothetical protein